MDKLLTAAASVVIAYVMPPGARAAVPNIVFAAASNTSAARDAVNVPGTKLVVVPPRLARPEDAKADGSGAPGQMRSENPANGLNWMQGGGG